MDRALRLESNQLLAMRRSTQRVPHFDTSEEMSVFGGLIAAKYPYSSLPQNLSYKSNRSEKTGRSITRSTSELPGHKRSPRPDSNRRPRRDERSISYSSLPNGKCVFVAQIIGDGDCNSFKI